MRKIVRLGGSVGWLIEGTEGAELPPSKNWEAIRYSGPSPFNIILPRNGASFSELLYKILSSIPREEVLRETWRYFSSDVVDIDINGEKTKGLLLARRPDTITLLEDGTPVYRYAIKPIIIEQRGSVVLPRLFREKVGKKCIEVPYYPGFPFGVIGVVKEDGRNIDWVEEVLPLKEGVHALEEIEEVLERMSTVPNPPFTVGLVYRPYAKNGVVILDEGIDIRNPPPKGDNGSSIWI